MDDGYPGGVGGVSVDGDENGDMIVTYTGCATWNTTAPAFDSWGRPAGFGAGADCTLNMRKLAAADGAVVWTKALPKMLRSCRATTDGSFFCGWSMAASDGTLDFGDGVTVVSEDGKAGIIKYNSAGVAHSGPRPRRPAAFTRWTSHMMAPCLCTGAGPRTATIR